MIVVPACNEAGRVGRLLDSLAVARAHMSPSISIRCVVVADSCTDRTAEVARRRLDAGADIVEQVEFGSVGRARRWGTDLGLTGVGDLQRVWIANTDADTVVPTSWLAVQVRLADRGYDAVAGTVSLLDDDDWCPETAERFERSYRWPAGAPHPHIHGCNLGVRASSYSEVGGWSKLRSAEGGDLWRRLTATERVLSSSDIRVATSARTQGRAPSGFAGDIADLSPSDRTTRRRYAHVGAPTVGQLPLPADPAPA